MSSTESATVPPSQPAMANGKQPSNINMFNSDHQLKMSIDSSSLLSFCLNNLSKSNNNTNNVNVKSAPSIGINAAAANLAQQQQAHNQPNMTSDDNETDTNIKCTLLNLNKLFDELKRSAADRAADGIDVAQQQQQPQQAPSSSSSSSSTGSSSSSSHRSSGRSDRSEENSCSSSGVGGSGSVVAGSILEAMGDKSAGGVAAARSTTSSTSSISASESNNNNNNNNNQHHNPHQQQQQQLHELSAASRIKYLEEELANVQADKEFVWSLWRQLQASSPSVTNAIGSVVQREKEKADARVAKCAEALEAERAQVAKWRAECVALEDKWRVCEVRLSARDEECHFLKLSAQTAGDKQLMYEQMLRARDLALDEASRAAQAPRARLDEANDQVARAQAEVAEATANYDRLVAELGKCKASQDRQLRGDNERLAAQLALECEKSARLRGELDELWVKHNAHMESTGEQHERMLRQMKQSQSELQRTIVSQQEAWTAENDALRAMYEQMSARYEESVAAARQANTEAAAARQQRQLQVHEARTAEKCAADKCKTLQYECGQVRLECQLRSQQLADKTAACEQMSKQIVELESKLQQLQQQQQKTTKSSSAISTKRSSLKKQQQLEDNNNNNNNNEVANGREQKLRRSKSLIVSHKRRSPLPLPLTGDDLAIGTRTCVSDNENDGERDDDDRAKPETNEKIIEDVEKLSVFYEKLCKAKDKRLAAMESAHHNRLERLVAMEKQYKLLRDHLASYTSDPTTTTTTTNNSNKTNGKSRDKKIKTSLNSFTASFFYFYIFSTFFGRGKAECQ